MVRQCIKLGDIWWSKVTHLTVARKQREEVGQSPNILFKGKPPMT
jgi:hypothetical protein